MVGRPKLSVYHYEIRVLALEILWRWEVVYWGSVSFDTKTRYKTAVQLLKKRLMEG